MKTFEIFTDATKKYQDRSHRGVFIDPHSQFIKISPTGYTGEMIVNDLVIPRSEIYDAIIAAYNEAKNLKLNKKILPLGRDTHDIKFVHKKTGLFSNGHIEILLDVTSPKEELESFKKLKEKYKISEFSLGRVPFHNNDLYRNITQILKEKKYTRIVSIFQRKRDQRTRVYVGIAMNSHFYRLRESVEIDFIDDHNEDTSIKPVKPVKQITSEIEI